MENELHKMAIINREEEDFSTIPDPFLSTQFWLTISDCDYDDAILEKPGGNGRQYKNDLVLYDRMSCFIPKLFPMEYKSFYECVQKKYEGQ